MNTLLNKGGIIVKDTDLESHWIIEFNDQTRIGMFDSCGNKRNFNEYTKHKRRIVACFWNPIANRMPKFGIINRSGIFCFFISEFAFYPDITEYVGSVYHEPKLFIRNFINTSFNSMKNSGHIEYYSCVDYIVNNNRKQIGISWDGINFKQHGFNNLIHIGKVDVK